MNKWHLVYTKLRREEMAFINLPSQNYKSYLPFISKGEFHQLRNPSQDILEVVEVQSGTYLGEDDIERIDDKYGR